MYFANPWGLFGLLALPAIVYIHLYHRRFPPLEIAGLHLWTMDVKKDSPGRTREKLPITRSLLLELLAALLITLLIADPREGSMLTRPHLVAVLDHSASMSAVQDSGQSSRDLAVKWLEDQRQRMGNSAIYSVITTGQRPTLIAGPRADWAAAQEALEQWQPWETQHDFEPAWDLAAQLAGDDSELIFVTDHLPADNSPVPAQMEVRSVGQPLDNVAVTAARWSYNADSGEGTLFARVANLSSDSTEVQILARSGGRTLIDEKQSLAAGMEKSFEWLVPGGLGTIEFSASAPKDPLAIDHTLTLVEPKIRNVTVAVTLPSSHPAFEAVKRILGVMPGVQLGDPGQADLVVAPAGDTPIAQRGLWWLGLGPQSLSETDRNSAKTLIGPYLLEKQHPLLNGVVLGGVVWGGVQKTPQDVIPLISAGTSLLFGQWMNMPANVYVLNIDLQSSNLTESPDWPIFWTNLIEQCRATRPGFRRWNFHLEEPIVFSLDPAQLDSPGTLQLLHNGETKDLIRTETVEIPPRDEVGLYEVRDEKTSLGTFAVNFLDREESNLLSLKSGSRQAATSSPALGIQIDNPLSWLLAIGILMVLIAIFLNWFYLRKASGTR